MTIGELITEARLKRRQELHRQLESMRFGPEPRDHHEFAAWKRREDEIRAELKIFEAVQ